MTPEKALPGPRFHVDGEEVLKDTLIKIRKEAPRKPPYPTISHMWLFYPQALSFSILLNYYLNK